MGIGTTLANFQSVGNLPVFKERLKSLVIPLAILVPVAFGICPVIPSAPDAFLVVREVRRPRICSSLQRYSSGIVDGDSQCRIKPGIVS